MSDDFNPDWTSPPGDTIRDLLREQGKDARWLARRLGRAEVVVHELLAGHSPMDADLAADLATVLGSTPGFWQRREQQYRLDLVKGRKVHSR